MLSRRSLLLGSAALPAAAALPPPVKARDVSTLAATIDEMEDLQGCEACAARVPIEAAVHSEGCYFCPACWKRFQEAFAACEHDWESSRDEMGDPGCYCRRCAGFVNTENAADVLTSGALSRFQIAVAA